MAILDQDKFSATIAWYIYHWLCAFIVCHIGINYQTLYPLQSTRNVIILYIQTSTDTSHLRIHGTHIYNKPSVILMCTQHRNHNRHKLPSILYYTILCYSSNDQTVCILHKSPVTRQICRLQLVHGMYVQVFCHNI